MTKLDEVTLQHIKYLVMTEHRPFSHHDFCSGEAIGQPYFMTHGTFRNKISNLIRLGVVELEYNAGTAFYTLRDELELTQEIGPRQHRKWRKNKASGARWRRLIPILTIGAY